MSKLLDDYLATNYPLGYTEMDRPEINMPWSRWCHKNGTNLYSDRIKHEFYGQAAQDLFVEYCLNQKTNGFFLEIGSNDPVFINNTFLLEHKYHWSGVMVEFLEQFRHCYQQIRPRSHHIIGDALKVDYGSLFEELKPPKNLDYLQVDLEWTGSLHALERIDHQLLSDYRFAVATYEHDHKSRPERLTYKCRSREIFLGRGYQPVFMDVKDIAGRPYEDWYVMPDLVDMNKIERVSSNESMTWQQIAQLLVS